MHFCGRGRLAREPYARAWWTFAHAPPTLAQVHELEARQEDRRPHADGLPREAGHAVLAAAIANPPDRITIKADEHTLGRSGARMSSRVPRPASRCSSRGSPPSTCSRVAVPGSSIGRSVSRILARLDPELGEDFEAFELRDGHRAVEEVLRMETYDDDDKVRRELDRFYDIARASLGVVWPSVEAVAKALLVREVLDRAAFDTAIGPRGLVRARAPVAEGARNASRGRDQVSRRSSLLHRLERLETQRAALSARLARELEARAKSASKQYRELSAYLTIPRTPDELLFYVAMPDVRALCLAEPKRRLHLAEYFKQANRKTIYANGDGVGLLCWRTSAGLRSRTRRAP